MSTLVLGNSPTPAAKTVNFDALFAQTLQNYHATLADNISTSNSFFLKLKQSGAWESDDGGTHIEMPLMYELGSTDTFDGYDTLDTQPIDGVTACLYEWASMATPITISGKEKRRNYSKHKLVDMMKTKITQAEMGMQESWSKFFFQGQGVNSGSILSPYVSPINGSSAFLPVSRLIHPTPSSSVVIGSINQNTYSWWRNQSVSASGITLYSELLQKIETLINNCSKGPGGAPDLAICDQTTFEMLKFAIYQRTRHTAQEDANWPFENVIFRRTMFVWDEFIGDPVNDSIGTSTAGTIYLINTKFMKVKYHPLANFTHTPMQKPVNQDASIGHILWEGAICTNNRRKHGILHTIPRTLAEA